MLTCAYPAERTRKLNAELANGSLAIMAIIGMFLHSGLTGSTWGDWALSEASSLSAFVNELRMQDPARFGDLLRFSADGGLLALKRRCCVELKHGRLSMLATMGYVTPKQASAVDLGRSPSIQKGPSAMFRFRTS